MSALRILGVSLILTYLLIGLFAEAHDWYPEECCGGQDCGPATLATIAGATYFAGRPAAQSPEAMPAFITLVTVTFTMLRDAPQITVPVPDGFPRQVSKDGRTHACVRNKILMCLFLPPTM